jgi:hypothetical protein
MLWSQQWILAFTIEVRKKGKKSSTLPNLRHELVILEQVALDGCCGCEQVGFAEYGFDCFNFDLCK